jgi:hypothetical protein
LCQLFTLKKLTSFELLKQFSISTLYFTTSDFIHKFLTFGSNIAVIELCQDAEFYIDPEQDKYKTNKFIITEFLSQTEEICKLVEQPIYIILIIFKRK